MLYMVAHSRSAKWPNPLLSQCWFWNAWHRPSSEKCFCNWKWRGGWNFWCQKSQQALGTHRQFTPNCACWLNASGSAGSYESLPPDSSIQTRALCNWSQQNGIFYQGFWSCLFEFISALVGWDCLLTFVRNCKRCCSQKRHYSSNFPRKHLYIAVWKVYLSNFIG